MAACEVLAVPRESSSRPVDWTWALRWEWVSLNHQFPPGSAYYSFFFFYRWVTWFERWEAKPVNGKVRTCSRFSAWQRPEGSFSWSDRALWLGERTVQGRDPAGQKIPAASTNSTSSCPERLEGLNLHQWSPGFSRGYFCIHCSARTKPLGGARAGCKPLGGSHRPANWQMRIGHAGGSEEIKVIFKSDRCGWVASLTARMYQQFVLAVVLLSHVWHF